MKPLMAQSIWIEAKADSASPALHLSCALTLTFLIVLLLATPGCRSSCCGTEALPRRAVTLEYVLKSDEEDCSSFLECPLSQISVFFENLALLRKYSDTNHRACKLVEP
jgi:hypothetical protein